MSSSRCIDCKKETCPKPRHMRWEYYMVWDKIWDEAGMEGDGGMLCIGCLEKRLGRQLTPKDFNDAPINELSQWDTDRLKDRKGHIWKKQE